MSQNQSFRFQELSELTGVKPYILRFWETEFPEISPQVESDGQKLYSSKDFEIVLKIKKLLYDKKMSIQEAKGSLHLAETNSQLFMTPELRSLSIELQLCLDKIHAIKTKYKWP
jgi:DNA-binding transcriptional MerR regulator